MQTKFDIGEKVFIEGIVDKVTIVDDKSEKIFYELHIKGYGYRTFSQEDLTSAKGVVIE